MRRTARRQATGVRNPNQFRRDVREHPAFQATVQSLGLVEESARRGRPRRLGGRAVERAYIHGHTVARGRGRACTRTSHASREVSREGRRECAR